MTHNKPSWWDGAGICAKASWLVASGRAKTFPDACSMLAKKRKKVAAKVSVEEYQQTLAKRGLD